MQDERLREDAKQLLRVARERRVVDGVGGLEVDLSAAAGDPVRRITPRGLEVLNEG